MVDYVRAAFGWEFESVERTELHKFDVMLLRWVVERTIGWMSNFRSLSKHYDYDSRTGETKILLASVYYLSKRLTHRKVEEEIDHARDAKLLQLAKQNQQPP